jgi:hypothetical protein
VDEFLAKQIEAENGAKRHRQTLSELAAQVWPRRSALGPSAKNGICCPPSSNVSPASAPAQRSSWIPLRLA